MVNRITFPAGPIIKLVNLYIFSKTCKILLYFSTDLCYNKLDTVRVVCFFAFFPPQLYIYSKQQ